MDQLRNYLSLIIILILFYITIFYCENIYISLIPLILIIIFHVFKVRKFEKLISENGKRKELELKLVKVSALFRTIVADLSSMVCRLDRSKKIIFFNKAFYQRFKIVEKRVIGKDIVAIFGEDEAVLINSKLDELSVADPSGSFEFSFMVGQIRFYYLINVQADYNEKKELSGYQLVFHDITDFKLSEQTERELSEMVKESERLSALGSLASGVSHNFNNLLTGIQGSVSILKLKFENNNEIMKRLNMIEEQIKEASRLSANLLSLAGMGKYVVTEFDPEEIIGILTENFSASYKNINITRKKLKEKVAVKGDRGQISLALTHILTNAVQAAGESGRIEIRTDIFYPGDSLENLHLKEEKYIRIIIIDNGPGIDESVRKKIFEPFITTKRNKKGFGLGLPSAWGIIKNHGGALTFETQLNIGTKFFVYLPVVK